MRIARGIAALSVASLAVLGLSACGGDDAPSPSKTSTPSASADAAGTSDDPTTDKPSTAAGGAEITAANFATRTMAAQADLSSMTMTMKTTSAGTTIDISADIVILDGKTQNMAMTMSGQGVDGMDIRMVDGIIYMGLGEMTGGKFIKVDPSDTTDPLASQFSGLTETMDPTASVAAFEGAIQSLEKVGEPEEVGGVTAQRYDLTVNAADLAADAFSQLGLTADVPPLPDSMTYSYWLDSEDRPVKMTTDAAGVSVEATFSNWDKDMNIVAPSADQITTM